MFVHGKEYLCVLKYSAGFASEQLNSTTATLAKVTQNLRRLAAELAKPPARFTETGIRNKIQRWLSDPFVREVLHYGLEQRENRWHLTFEVDNQALQQLWSQRLGRTVLLTNRMDWTAEQVVAAYSGQQQIERVFRGLKDGEWLGWGPMYHWTDSKFACMLSTACWESRCSNMCIVSPRPPGPISPWNNCGNNSAPSNSSFCCILRSETKVQIALLPSCLSRLWLNKLSPVPWVWTSSVVPNVGNTSSPPKPLQKQAFTAVPSGLRVNSR